ncbi:hypothetical protein C4B63_97g13 [Trypanosoma cruzi]|nr:hypothetical protein C4B63_97g13 [Trypanosoma cruzi]
MPSKGSAANTTTGSQLEVFDSSFKCLYTVPSHLVVHTPPARFNISRFVICRNYRCGEADSCTMGENCKFVHADVDYSTLEGQPIHVNYIWRDEKLCIYERLPPGDVLEVLLPNCKHPAVMISSEYVLATRGARSFSKGRSQTLSHCAHYYFNYLCSRGEDCSFIHAIYVDPTISEVCKRAAGRSHRQRVPGALRSSVERADSDSQLQCSRQRKKCGVPPEIPVTIEARNCRGDGVMAPTVNAEGLNSWAGLNGPSEASSEGPRHSSSGEEGTLGPLAGLKCREPNGVQMIGSACGQAAMRRARVYRHDPYGIF